MRVQLLSLPSASHTSRARQQQGLADLLIFPPNETAREFLKRQGTAPEPPAGGGGGSKPIDKRPGGLKAGATARSASVAAAARLMQGRHSDGQPLWLMCQVCGGGRARRGGRESRYPG